MTFEVLPTIERMLDLYAQPRRFERFQDYLQTLQGNTKGDLAVPIQGFNPMAKEQASRQLGALQTLGAETIMEAVCRQLNADLQDDSRTQVFKIALNLSDDLQGGWTNRYTSDYAGKFQSHALVKRGFCSPIFWTSEQYSTNMIRLRCLEYAYRTLYQLDHPKPSTLGEHVEQEMFVARQTGQQMPPQADFPALERFYQAHQASTDYSLIFCFFYGDAAAQSLGFPVFGVEKPFAGFDFARQI